MLQYVIAGLALGGLYAIAASGLVVTYLSSGILNFAFGSTAYFIARFFYFLNTQHGWGIAPAALVALGLAGPALGVLFYFALFRFLTLSSTLIKVVATLGLSLMLPYLATLLFGNVSILGKAPGLAPEPPKVFHVFGAPVTMNQIIVFICVLLVVAVGAGVLRYTDVGLRVRAMVDSPAMTSLSGTNPTAVSVGVWAVSIFLAGLVGVLSAPIIGLDATDFTYLMAAAFAAVIAAQLRNLSVAVVVGLLMGIAGSVIPQYLPPNSPFTQAVIPSIPFVVMAVFLIYFLVRRGRLIETEGTGGALDRAIAVQGAESAVKDETGEVRLSSRPVGWVPSILGFAVVCALPFVLSGLWIGLLATGVAYGVLFLGYTLVTGEGGMVWLCVPTFAAVGGLMTGQLAGLHGWPVLGAVVVGGLVAVPFGLILGALTIRLGNLYVALVTLTFGLLMENLVFSQERFLNQGLGVTVPMPGFATTPKAFTYLALAIFAVIAVFIVNLRRSTTGMALSAVRWSEPGAKTIGLSVLHMKVVTAGLAAFIAGIGGSLLAISLGVALPNNYATLLGVAWLAVVVLCGIRSNIAALVAGLMTTLLPGVAENYLPAWFQQIPPILFGLGAIGIARSPDGVLADYARQLRTLAARARARRHRGSPRGMSPAEAGLELSAADGLGPKVAP
jgi:branched-chain amino acid transport system permease protein